MSNSTDRRDLKKVLGFQKWTEQSLRSRRNYYVYLEPKSLFKKGFTLVTTLARYSWYIPYRVVYSIQHDYLHARRLNRRALLDTLVGEFDMFDSERSEQSSTCSTANRANKARHVRQRTQRIRRIFFSIQISQTRLPYESYST